MHYYYDLDGTLVDFESQPNALQRYNIERGFFKKLKATKHCNEVVKQLTDYSIIHILSTSPNEQATKDKIEWIKENLPNLPLENIHIVYDNKDKAQYAKGNVLIDDHTPNLIDWIKNNGHGIKSINKVNGKGGKHKRLGISTIIVD